MCRGGWGWGSRHDVGASSLGFIWLYRQVPVWAVDRLYTHTDTDTDTVFYLLFHLTSTPKDDFSFYGRFFLSLCLPATRRPFSKAGLHDDWVNRLNDPLTAESA